MLRSDNVKPSTACPDSHSFLLFARGTVDEQTRRTINQHIAFCGECYREYLALAEPEELLKRVQIGPGQVGVAIRTGNLSLKERNENDVIVVECQGILFGSDESPFLREFLRSILEFSQSKLVLDLTKVVGIMPEGLGALVTVNIIAKQEGGAMKLANLNRRFAEQNGYPEVLALFEIFDSVNDALSSFQEEGRRPKIGTAG